MEKDAPLYFASVVRWRQWLRRNAAGNTGAWVLLAKKGTKEGIDYRGALEEALCWGWIDSKTHRHDERHFAQWFSPRRPGSVWSLANRRTVERLMAEGRMQAAGLARIREAKASGQWDNAYASAAPPRLGVDVRRALADSGLLATWKRLAPSHRLQYLYWIGEAKRPETRARRIAKLPQLLKEIPARHVRASSARRK